MKLTEEQEKNYLENPTNCPQCGSGVISADDFEPLEPSRHVACNSCGASWNEVFQLVSVQDFKEGTFDEGEEDMFLTVEQLKAIAPDGCFAQGTATNCPAGIYMSMQREGELLMWIAVRGTGHHDWAIYINWASDGWDSVLTKGEKVTSKANIQKLVDCDDEALALYRY